MNAHDFVRDGTVPDPDFDPTFGIEDIYAPETYETDDPDLLAAEEHLATAIEHWHELDPQEQAQVEQLADLVDGALEAHRAAEVEAARVLVGLEAAGHDLGTFARLLDKHDGDVDAALAAMNRIGPPRSNSLDDALRHFFRENRELRD